MRIRLHPHCIDRLTVRGTNEDEVKLAIITGEKFDVKFGRTCFRKNFNYGKEWRGKTYSTKQIEVIAVQENDEWLALTVIAKYF